MNHDRPPDVPAHADESALSVELHGRCSDCGRTANAPRHAVADFPSLSTDGDPRGRLRCVDCFAAEIAEWTSLNTKLGRVLALELAGYSHDQISKAEGRSVTRIEQRARRIRDRARAVGEEYETLSVLSQYL